MENPVRINTLYNVFVERYIENLSIYSIPINSTCGIHIGEIKGTFKRCFLKILNMCINDKELSFNILIKTLKDVTSTLSQKEKEELSKEIGIDILNNDPKYVPEIIRNCSSSADVTNIIDIQTLDVGKCIAPYDKQILLQIVNSGTAEANCVMNSIMNSMNRRYIDNANIYNYLNLTNRPWFIFSIIIIAIIFVIGICSIKRRIGIKYKYGTFLYV
ncbi:SPV021 hypothetical protein [Swinepox virus]|uniref:EFC-associated protein OPG053 n=3 Tax=Swinepox virus TaxID=10276 RepID=PG053_SWPVK|nr:S-S bond formation pathway protein [Swinepox virus]P32207.1 RecName: Full=EFC-associated protein OPG053; AltName: Full=F9 protein homolog; AltName: Full=Protein C19 [Swinepox virus (STRAIN KASZA)]AAC37852.1 ORF C19L [Swinepox virus]AAL69760.1 SPV021 hypothetical protein [Swinepox virus]QQG31511.1 S-S bond formation pathway protein [Swinepox virus]UED36619.1 S-S bond formation pathway protein [Swinepox virus]UUA44211.1 SPV021 [Swinepox virus]